MNTMVRVLLCALGVAGLASAASPAFAREAGSETSTAEQTYPGFAIPQGQTHHQLESSRTELSRGVFAFVSYSSSNFGMISTRSMAIS